MKHQTRSVTFRCDLDQYGEILALANRYGMTVTDAISFLLDCGLDVEKDYRPILKTAVKVRDLLTDLQSDKRGEQT